VRLHTGFEALAYLACNTVTGKSRNSVESGTVPALLAMSFKA
jgi:hypothetical protein